MSEFEAEYIGISRFDDRLGYVPREGFDGVINAPGWTNVKVTITNDGFRLNNVEMEPRISEVLVVGDSFTFCYQVSNPRLGQHVLRKNLIGV